MEKDNNEINPRSLSMDEIITSGIIYESLCENYGKEAVDAVLKHLEIVQTDVCLGDNTKIIIRILNGDL